MAGCFFEKTSGALTYDPLYRYPQGEYDVCSIIYGKNTSHFFIVVQLLSKAVPIIGIQVNIEEIGDKKSMHFTKIIDSYEEVEVEEISQKEITETDWKKMLKNHSSL